VSLYDPEASQASPKSNGARHVDSRPTRRAYRRAPSQIATFEDGERTGTTTEPFETTFMLSRPTGGRWLTMGTLPYGERTLGA